MTFRLLAPADLIELSMYSCKTGCSSEKCTSQKNNLLSTEMKKRSDACENSDCNEKEAKYESKEEISDLE